MHRLNLPAHLHGELSNRDDCGRLVHVDGNAGTPVSTTGLAAAAGINTPASLTVDTAGSLWIANSGSNTITEVIGVAAPVATPVLTQVINATPGVKP